MCLISSQTSDVSVISSQTSDVSVISCQTSDVSVISSQTSDVSYLKLRDRSTLSHLVSGASTSPGVPSLSHQDRFLSRRFTPIHTKHIILCRHEICPSIRNSDYVTCNCSGKREGEGLVRTGVSKG